tara:strand:- start:196 stop:345 length:150 start_codon:yes stop_codon:yes gene_type:complete
MSWSSKYTVDIEGNKIRKSTYELNIVREGYFFHDLREEELCYLNRVYPK